MPSIQSTINFSFSNLTTGRITATPRGGDYFDSAGKVVIADIPFPSVNITGGNASFVLPSSKDFGIGIEFVIETGTSPNFIFVDKFQAVIENITPINGNTLMVNSYQTVLLLDTSIQAISNLLTTDETYLTRLSQRIPGFIFKAYTATTAFKKNEFTMRSNRFYQWIKDTQGTGVDPLTLSNVTDPGNYLNGTVNTSASWLVASGSLVGSGTSTTELAYNSSTFANLPTDPMSRQNGAQLETLLRSTISTPDLSTYAQKTVANAFNAIQNFNAGATVPNLSVNDSSGSVPNTKFVKDVVNALGSFNLVNKFAMIEERRNQGVAASGVVGSNNRLMNTITYDPSNILSLETSGIFNITIGTYLLIAFAISSRAAGSRLHLYNNAEATSITTRSMSGFTGDNLGNTSAQNVTDTLIDVISMTASSTPCTLRHVIKVGGADALGVAANVSGFSEVFARLMLFKLN